jgi:hypothetical protein
MLFSVDSFFLLRRQHDLFAFASKIRHIVAKASFYFFNLRFKEIFAKGAKGSGCFLQRQPPIGAKRRSAAGEQHLLLCALSPAAYIQPPSIFLFGFFCHPFGGQKPSLIVYHVI